MSVQEISTIIPAIVLIIQVGLAIWIATINNKSDRTRLAMEKFVGFSEKENFTVTIVTQEHCKQTIEITNSGVVPIDETQVKIGLIVSRKSVPDISLNIEWESKEVLNSREKAIIPLYEKLDPLLDRNKLVTERSVSMPTGEVDEQTGEYTDYTETVRDLHKLFTVEINLAIKTKSYDVTRNINKKFRLSYDWLPEVYSIPPQDFQYEDNFSVQVTDVRGKWNETDSSLPNALSI